MRFHLTGFGGDDGFFAGETGLDNRGGTQMNLAGKVAIVTGSGGGGTGRSTARRLAREGAAVVVNDVNDPGGRETVALIEADGGLAAFCCADVKIEADIKALIAFAESTFGGLDVLVNNASSPDGLGLLTGWIDAVRIEVLGPMHATLAAIEAMRRRGGGAIVNIGSTSAIGHGRKHSPWPAYDVGKMAQIRLTTTLACLRDQENIRVNCLVPSWVASPGPKEYWESLTPEQRKERGVPDALISGWSNTRATHRTRWLFGSLERADRQASPPSRVGVAVVANRSVRNEGREGAVSEKGSRKGISSSSEIVPPGARTGLGRRGEESHRESSKSVKLVYTTLEPGSPD
jgi:NAD(P)-dependent dehydrogenase (short-subunit alcohol dehydrogenase family)